MIETLLEWDTKLLIWLNSFHNATLDRIMFLLSQTWFWIPLYGLLVWIVIRNYARNAWVVVASAGLTILFTDQFTSSFMKPIFGRLRPSHEPALEGMLHFVRDLSGEVYVGGLYGFASGHAATTFGTATFLVLVLRNSQPWIGWLYAWAVIMTYTRIYMGVHYPGDIIVGASIGVFGGWLGFRFCKWSLSRITKPVNKT